MRAIGGTMVLLSVATALGAQQVDTTVSLRRGRAVEMLGTSGSVELRTWSRPEVRVQVRGAGASRVQFRESASRVFIEERAVRADSVIWRFVDSTGALRATVGVRAPAVQVMPGRGPIVERGTVGPPRGDSTRAVRVDSSASGVSAFRGAISGPVVERGRVVQDSSDLPPIRQGQRGADWTFRPQTPVPASVDYVITVPERAHVIIRGNNVDIAVAGQLDTLEVSNVRGSIRASKISGHTTLTSLDGRVLVEGSDGDLFARTLSGSVVVRDALGSVEAQGIAGSIELEDVRAPRIKASTYDGGIRLQGALPLNGSIQLSTFRGPLGFPASGACASPLDPAVTLQTIRPSSRERFDIQLTTTTPAGVNSGPATCTLRRE